jgi:hypothetical protein
MRASLVCILLATLASMGTLQRLMVQGLPKCESARVHYTPFADSYSARIQVNSLSESVTELSTHEKVFSPQHTRWWSQVLPDTMKPGPWTTRVFMGTGESDPNVELRFVDEGSGGVDVHWLNEKLIFGEVWWGRIYATDFVFDVEQRRFTYREMAHFGELIAACR